MRSPRGQATREAKGEQDGEADKAQECFGEFVIASFVRRKCPVIPTVLIDAIKTPELPWTLRNRHWVDFRVSEPDPLKQLIWGITDSAKETETVTISPPLSTASGLPRMRL